MQRDTSGSTSRRTFVKYGLVTTGAVLGPSSASTASSDARTDADGPDADSSRSLEQGVMRSYQYVPDSRITIDDAVDWQPAGLEGSYRTYAVSYDHAPSYQALFFADDGRSAAGDPESDDGGPDAETERAIDALRPGDALSLGSVRGSPSEASRKYVTVGLDGLESDGGDSADE